jgi:hypothetical protein
MQRSKAGTLVLVVLPFPDNPGSRLWFTTTTCNRWTYLILSGTLGIIYRRRIRFILLGHSLEIEHSLVFTIRHLVENWKFGEYGELGFNVLIVFKYQVSINLLVIITAVPVSLKFEMSAIFSVVVVIGK